MTETTDIRKAIADLLRNLADGVERLPKPTLAADPNELVPVVHRPDRHAARAGKFPACVVSRKLMARRVDLLAWQASRTAARADESPPQKCAWCDNRAMSMSLYCRDHQ